MPLPVGVGAHLLDASSADFCSKTGPKRCHKKRTDS
jgi:hypothetical protein